MAKSILPFETYSKDYNEHFHRFIISGLKELKQIEETIRFNEIGLNAQRILRLYIKTVNLRDYICRIKL